MKKAKKYIGAAAVGFINGIFGAGGGMLAIPLLKSAGLPEKEAHRSALALIFPLTIFSILLYYFDGRMTLTDGFEYFLPGIAGAIIGAFLLNRIPDKLLRSSFSLLLIFSGIRMLFK